MLNAIAFANASTVVTAVFYVLIILATYVAPDFVFNIVKSWLNSVKLDSPKAKTVIPIDKAVIGLVSVSIITWITIYAMIWLYNIWA
jgi:hypothetical protein